MTTTRPAFRKPWHDGAKAYIQADTLDALREGMKRCRNSAVVTIHRDAIGHLPCARCGVALDQPYILNEGEDKRVTDDGEFLRGTYFPRNRTFVPYHYYCGWSMLMTEVIRMGRALRL